MPKSGRFLIPAVVAGLAGLAALLWTYWSVPPGEDVRIPGHIGRELALETLRLRGSGGRVIALVRDTEEFPQKAVDIALKEFVGELGRAGVTVDTVRRFQVDPLRMVQVPPGDFFELMRRSKEGDVVVSFMGPPLLSEEQRANLGQVKPKVVAFCPGYLPRYINLSLMVERGILHGGVVALPDAAGDRYEGQYTRLVAGTPGNGTGAKGGGTP